MAQYATSVDICNRALQHVGAQRITALTDDSKSADAVEFAYDKVRRAELRRNLWRFATRRVVLRAIDTDTLILAPGAYSSTVRYQPGTIITYGGVTWVSKTAWNLNNTPGTTTDWDIYFGPLTVTEYDSTLTYQAGELVYVASGTAGLASIYAARTTASGDPTVIPAYASGTTYSRGDNVVYSSANYLSLINLNLANTPASTYSLWDIAHSYSLNDVVVWTDGRLYTSQGNANLANVPSLTSTHWTAASSPPYVQPWLVFTGGVGAQDWRYIGDGVSMELVSPNIIYPVDTGPSSSSDTRNIFLLPNGFLKIAPTDPKAGSQSFLGASSALQYNDWIFENNYMISRDVGPVMLRFVADVTNVPDMDDMFCEGLAARIALEICEEITQSTDKKAIIAQEYKKFMGEARAANCVELGAIEPPMDDYLACRV